MPLDSSAEADGKIETVHLLASISDDMEMSSRASPPSNGKADLTRVDTSYTDAPEPSEPSTSEREILETEGGQAHARDEEETLYRVYKVRWFGLLVLVMLNVIVCWDVSTISNYL